MALRRGKKVDLTVAMAMVDRFIKSEDDYFKRKDEIYRLYQHVDR